jgi:hypothetical protein
MNAIKKFILMIYFRVRTTAPKFFQWVQGLGWAVLAYGFTILTLVPSLDVPLFAIHKGMDYQKVFYLGELLTALGIGLVIPSSMVVQNFQEYLYKLRSKGVDVPNNKPL